ncbi:hypothetical protein SDC9_131851 [bioreactor metagenome]|uniref:Uncharacterized protein n=1 Tax=bioreactor metagenome TaxID=1076179 RepID=A0A645D6F7_9ZZZZ
MHDHAARTVRLTKPDISGVDAAVAVKRLGDGGGGEIHTVQITAGFPEGFAGDEALCDAFLFLLIKPFQVNIQIDALAAAVVHGAEKARAFGDFPAVSPLVAHQKVFIGQIARAFEPVLKLRKDLLRRALADAPDGTQLFGIGFPNIKINRIHLFLLRYIVWPPIVRSMPESCEASGSDAQPDMDLATIVSSCSFDTPSFWLL